MGLSGFTAVIDQSSVLHRHAVQFYEKDENLAQSVARFLADGLRLKQPVVIIATEAHQLAIMARLRRLGFDPAKERREGNVLVFDAHRTLDAILEDGVPHEGRFDTIVGAQIRKAAAKGPVCAYGEMVDVLWQQREAAAAIRLEELWNALLARHHVSLLCAYDIKRFGSSDDTDRFRAVCDLHTHVLPADSHPDRTDEERLREITLLQQRARALENEIEQRALLQGKLAKALDSLTEREQELREILENAADGIHMVSGDGIIQWANKAELDMLGYSAEEYIGHPIEKFHADKKVIADILARLGRGETIHAYEAPMRCRDGSIRHVLVSSNVRWENGKFVTTRCFSKDITEIKKAHEDAVRAHKEADRARAVAEEANRAKSDFLAVMSHELRTPLNAIGGYAELMELGVQGPVSRGQKELLERIQKNQRHLLGLINQVLNYARIETGNLHYDIDDVALDEVLSTSEALIFPQLRSRGLSYKYEKCDPSIVVRADPEKLQQVLLNLLTNAVKFTEKGGSVLVTAEAGESHVRVKITDTGIGIPADKLENIFEPFIQANPNYTRPYEGVGLGLAVSRDLARGMNADLTVESMVGKGSTFTLSLERSPR